MSITSGFTLIEVLISLLLLCLAGMAALSISLVARQQIITATQHTIAFSLTAELVDRMASHDDSDETYTGVHPLWNSEEPAPCTESEHCDHHTLSQFHLYSALKASAGSKGLQLLQQPALCIRQSGSQKLVQLSWRSVTKVQIQRPVSVCDISPNRLRIALVAP